jgi:hypothetical protein
MRTLNPAEENLELEALQALAYEGTPLEIATNFKVQGNEAFREKRVRDALEFYTKGIRAGSGDEGLDRTLLLNRAACHLELGMHGSGFRGANGRELWKGVGGLWTGFERGWGECEGSVSVCSRLFRVG